MKSFNYLGMRFKPIRQFTADEEKRGIGLPLRSTGVSDYDTLHNNISSEWNWEQFYKAAGKAGAGEMDIFLWRGKHVVPGTHELWEYTEA